jgi:hypothetical protein
MKTLSFFISMFLLCSIAHADFFQVEGPVYSDENANLYFVWQDGSKSSLKEVWTNTTNLCRELSRRLAKSRDVSDCNILFDSECADKFEKSILESPTFNTNIEACQIVEKIWSRCVSACNKFKNPDVCFKVNNCFPINSNRSSSLSSHKVGCTAECAQQQSGCSRACSYGDPDKRSYCERECRDEREDCDRRCR